MRAFTQHSGRVAAMDRANVDTDQIIPKQFLKRIERTGFGEFLFYDWRRLSDGSPNPEFELNRPENQGATILLARRNFGSGSSREHAPWALDDYGFRAIIAPSFADIFYQNCLKTGLLPIVLAEDEVDELFRRARSGGCELSIDLVEQTVRDGRGFEARFAIDPFAKRCLLEGLDEIGLTLAHEAEIAAYEAAHASR